MKIKHFSLMGLLIVTILAIGGNFSRAIGGSNNVTGHCAELECDELIDELRSIWPEKITQYESECQGKNILGLDVWDSGEGRRVSFACWGEKESNGSRSGDALGMLPFPGEEETFASPWSCYDESCKELVTTLKESYPEETSEYETECAMKAGDLQLLVLDEQEQVDIQCVFSAGVVLLDRDGDGISEGENNNGTFVDVILGSFPLPQ